ncbi:M14 family metallopeptidase [Flavobacterium sp.]
MKNYLALYQEFKEISISGRYISLRHIELILKKFNAVSCGQSVLGRPIYKLQFGTGKIKILMWSQMHGNESTTTKAVLDFVNYLHGNSTESTVLLEKFTFCLVPMLNPDGANAYTRGNANDVDLNRDAKEMTQPESKILRTIFDDFKPNYCYNLHDQRTIFGVAETGKPATISFLSPAYDEDRNWNECRGKAAELIVAMTVELQKYIPSQVGRFDDSFNINCVGDMFQFLNVPTILFEAGHFPNDYEREITRQFVFVALLSSVSYLSENDIVRNKIADYLTIPQNKINFYDFVCKNVKINYDSTEKRLNFALQYKEVLNDGKIEFEAWIAQVENLENYFGHSEINVEGKTFFNNHDELPIINEKANFSIGNGIKFVNGIKIC